MKHILKLTFAALVMSFTFTSCLKDKGYDNGDYGMQVVERKAVSLPQAVSGSVSFALFSQDQPQVLAAPVFALEAIGRQSADVKVQFALKPDLVTSDPDLTLLPASEYVVDLVNAKIAAGQLLDTLEITIPKSSNLDPNLIYGLGLELVSADNGFQVASNMKEVLIKITVKNKYDGLYEVTGTYRDVSPAGANFSGRYPLEYYLVTTGPSSVNVCMQINGEITPGYLFSNAGAGSYYGSFGLAAYFNPATDAITEVRNYYGDPANPATGVGNPGAGSGAPNYASANNRRATLDPTGINAYDANTKVVKIKYFMIQPTVVPNGPRAFFNETWTYIGPRP
ncbi:MAG: hypothetical protein ACKO5C_06420 [Ferruginibacter sp.]